MIKFIQLIPSFEQNKIFERIFFFCIYIYVYVCIAFSGLRQISARVPTQKKKNYHNLILPSCEQGSSE